MEVSGVIPAGTRPLDVARSISQRLADDAIVARVNEDLWDLTRALESDTKLEILTTRNPEALEVYRHSTGASVGRGRAGTVSRNQARHRSAHRDGSLLRLPARRRSSLPKISKRLEARMWEIQARDLTYERKYTPKEEGV